MRANVFVSATGNLFMTEIGELLASGLREMGIEVELRRSGLPEPESGVVNVVVAPHEYFPLLSGVHHETASDSVEHCAVLLTEQPGSSWFHMSLAYAARARAVLDINPAGVTKLRALGIDAHLLPLGYHRSWDHWMGQPVDRPVDVVFMGGLTPRREAQLATMAATLSALDCRLLFHDARRPQTAAGPNYVHGSEKFELLKSTKVLLNIHRDETPYLEWHRLLGAMANGCVVLTETVGDATPLEPFRHFAMCDLALLPDYLALLTADNDLLDSIRTEAYEFLREQLDLRTAITAVWPVLEAATSPRAPQTFPMVSAVLAEAFGAGSQDPPPTPAPAAVAAADAASLGALLKRQILAEARLRRRVDALECHLRFGSGQRVSVSTTAGHVAVRPDVSVVMPLHNYADTVVEAMQSVVESLGILPELVVVDDHSTDESANTVRRFMAEHPSVPMKLVALDANVGLAEARNIGFTEARADYVFLLDADNLVYPAALRKLATALSSSGAAFAYSMIECFGSHRRLISVYPWNVDRLLDFPYIDAMSLVRKEAWEKVGGFVSDLRIYGWEDYAFWLSLADAGYEGLLVPELLCRYRLHEDSMINVTNLDLRETLKTVQSMYASLPWSRVHA